MDNIVKKKKKIKKYPLKQKFARFVDKYPYWKYYIVFFILAILITIYILRCMKSVRYKF
ncbi:MAG TPA: hypothetical protein PLD27_10740 [bacterium]|nr:hypothetical protein [bacterium]HOL48524.1 hypothetical protein [bacterium]HPQ19700.1 hypothetical protein [bacterium]